MYWPPCPTDVDYPSVTRAPFRPQLNYTELYNLEGCATFVADLMAYETLEDPLHPPENLPSPMSTLGWQVSLGDLDLEF